MKVKLPIPGNRSVRVTKSAYGCWLPHTFLYARVAFANATRLVAETLVFDVYLTGGTDTYMKASGPPGQAADRVSVRVRPCPRLRVSY